MVKSLIAATLLTMGVGGYTPTPNFIRAELTQNTSYTYEIDGYELEQMNDNYADNFAYDSWISTIDGETEFVAVANDKPHIYEEDSYYFIDGYYGTTNEDDYNSMIEETKWNNAPGWENTSYFVFKESGTVVKQNATITVEYQSNIKYYGCQWLSRVSIYYTTSDLLDELYENASTYDYYTNYASTLAWQLDVKHNQYNSVYRNQAQDYGTYGIIESGSLLIWPEPATKELTLDITLSYGYETYIFVVLQTFYLETSTTEYGYIKGNGTDPDAEDGLMFNYIQSATLDYLVPSDTITMEYIDIPNMMFNILTMPFAFISQAFNLTIFPGTAYAVNISNLFLAIIGIAVFVFILKKILKG